VIAVLPGCDGFDAKGYDESLNIPREGECEADLKARAKAYTAALIRSYERDARDHLARGLAVMKVDYTKPSTSGPVHEKTNCQDVTQKWALPNVAKRLGHAIALLRSRYPKRVARNHVYVIGSSLGGGGILSMFEQWETFTEDQRPNRAVLYFPACKTDLKPWQAKVPTLVLMGSKDNVPVGPSSSPEKVQPLAPECRRQVASAGANVILQEYPETYHAFSVPGPAVQIDARIPLVNYEFVAYRRNDQAAAAAAKATREALK